VSTESSALQFADSGFGGRDGECKVERDKDREGEEDIFTNVCR